MCQIEETNGAKSKELKNLDAKNQSLEVKLKNIEDILSKFNGNFNEVTEKLSKNEEKNEATSNTVQKEFKDLNNKLAKITEYVEKISERPQI